MKIRKKESITDGKERKNKIWALRQEILRKGEEK